MPVNMHELISELIIGICTWIIRASFIQSRHLHMFIVFVCNDLKLFTIGKNKVDFFFK